MSTLEFFETSTAQSARLALDAQINPVEAASLLKDSMFSEALKRSNGNVTRAARRLGVHRNSVQNWKRQQARFA